MSERFNFRFREAAPVTSASVEPLEPGVFPGSAPLVPAAAEHRRTHGRAAASAVKRGTLAGRGLSPRASLSPAPGLFEAFPMTQTSVFLSGRVVQRASICGKGGKKKKSSRWKINGS